MCRMYSTGAYWFLLMMMRINYGFQTQTQTTYQLRWSSRLVTLLWTERHVQCIFQLNFNFSIKRFENVHISSGHVKSVKETINQRNLKKNFQKLHPQSKVKWMKKKTGTQIDTIRHETESGGRLMMTTFRQIQSNSRNYVGSWWIKLCTSKCPVWWH